MKVYLLSELKASLNLLHSTSYIDVSHASEDEAENSSRESINISYNFIKRFRLRCKLDMQFPELSSYTVTKFPVIERYYRTHKLGELVHLNIELILESLDTSIQKSETLGFLTAGHLVH